MTDPIPVGRPFLIGISGGSCSGKTTLAKELVDLLGASVSLLMFDDYYHDLSALEPSERAIGNYDHPDALDVDLFLQHLRSLAAGNPVEVPEYDFSTHTRRGPTHTVEPASFVVIDGILLLHLEQIRRELALTVFVDAPENIRLARRIERDVRERGRDPAGVRSQFATTVKPMHDAFVLPSRRHAELVFTHPFGVSEAARKVLDRLG